MILARVDLPGAIRFSSRRRGCRPRVREARPLSFLRSPPNGEGGVSRRGLLASGAWGPGLAPGPGGVSLPRGCGGGGRGARAPDVVGGQSRVAPAGARAPVSRSIRNPAPLRPGMLSTCRTPGGSAMDFGPGEPVLSLKLRSRPVCSLQQLLYIMKGSFAVSGDGIIKSFGKGSLR